MVPSQNSVYHRSDVTVLLTANDGLASEINSSD